MGPRYIKSWYHGVPLFSYDGEFPMTEDRDPLFQKREKTHGSFAVNAAISQRIKDVYHRYGKYPIENPIYCEALDMIALKLSRILSGQANFKDHWRDLSGYALLAMEACDDDKK